MSQESFPKKFVSRYGEISPDGPAHFPVVLGKTKKLWLTEPHITNKDLEKIKAPTVIMSGEGEDSHRAYRRDASSDQRGATLHLAWCNALLDV